MSLFKRAIAMFAAISAAMQLPFDQRRAAMGKIGPYRSRGHGWGLLEPQYNRQAMRSRYMPHQGERECERRRIGGFAQLRSPDALHRAYGFAAA